MNPVNFYAAARHNYELVVIGSQHEAFRRNPDRFLLAISKLSRFVCRIVFQIYTSFSRNKRNGVRAFRS